MSRTVPAGGARGGPWTLAPPHRAWGSFALVRVPIDEIPEGSSTVQVNIDSEAGRCSKEIRVNRPPSVPPSAPSARLERCSTVGATDPSVRVEGDFVSEELLCGVEWPGTIVLVFDIDSKSRLSIDGRTFTPDEDGEVEFPVDLLPAVAGVELAAIASGAAGSASTTFDVAVVKRGYPPLRGSVRVHLASWAGVGAGRREARDCGPYGDGRHRTGKLPHFVQDLEVVVYGFPGARELTRRTFAGDPSPCPGELDVAVLVYYLPNSSRHATKPSTLDPRPSTRGQGPRLVAAPGRAMEEGMRCVICKQGETRPGEVTVTLERDGATIVVKGVPGSICANCGEEYVDEAVAGRLLRDGERAAADGVQVDVRRYVAA